MRTRNKQQHTEETLHEEKDFTFTNPDEELTETEYQRLLANVATETGVEIGKITIQEFDELYNHETSDVATKVGAGGDGIAVKHEGANGVELVKIHFIPPYLMDADDKKRGILAEAALLSRLDNEMFPKHHGFLEVERNNMWLSKREYLEGESWLERLEKGELTEEEIVGTATQTASRLAWLNKPTNHPRARFPITHRDIKPSNIIITPEGTVKLIDFTAASMKQGDYSTISGKQFSPPYISPQQAAGRIDARTDTYSLGISMAQAILGELPDEYRWGIAGRQPDFTHLPVTSKLREYMQRMVELDMDERPTPEAVARELPKTKNIQVAVPEAYKQETKTAEENTPESAKIMSRFDGGTKEERQAATYLEDLLIASGRKIETPYKTERKKKSVWEDRIQGKALSVQDTYLTTERYNLAEGLSRWMHNFDDIYNETAVVGEEFLEKAEAFAKATRTTQEHIDERSETLDGALKVMSAIASYAATMAVTYAISENLAFAFFTGAVIGTMPAGIGFTVTEILRERAWKKRTRRATKEAYETVESLPALAEEMYVAARAYRDMIQQGITVMNRIRPVPSEVKNTLKALEYIIEHPFDIERLASTPQADTIRDRFAAYEAEDKSEDKAKQENQSDPSKQIKNTGSVTAFVNKKPLGTPYRTSKGSDYSSIQEHNSKHLPPKQFIKEKIPNQRTKKLYSGRDENSLRKYHEKYR